jgi:hypothetical protein
MALSMVYGTKLWRVKGRKSMREAFGPRSPGMTSSSATPSLAASLLKCQVLTKNAESQQRTKREARKNPFLRLGLKRSKVFFIQ